MPVLYEASLVINAARLFCTFNGVKRDNSKLNRNFAGVNIETKKDMEAMNFRKYSDEEFKEALRATLNLKKEWMASVTQRERELGIQ